MRSVSTYTEEELLQKIADGDESAFRYLVNTWSDLLGTHIYRLTRSHETTEEIVQDVFLKIWNTREGLAEVKNFRTWLYVVSRNQAIMALRKIILQKSRHAEWQKTAAIGEEDSIHAKEAQLSVVEQAIEQLPAQQKKAWVLSRRQGLSYKEIADAMGVSTETVKKHIQYASLSITRYVETHIGLALLVILLKNSHPALPLF